MAKSSAGGRDGDGTSQCGRRCIDGQRAWRAAGLGTEAEPNEQVRPAVPLQEKLTLPEKPLSEVTVMVSVVELPWVTDSLPLVEASEKSGLVPLTMTVTGTRWVILPLEAVTLTAPVSEYPLVVLYTVSVELTARAAAGGNGRSGAGGRSQRGGCGAGKGNVRSAGAQHAEGHGACVAGREGRSCWKTGVTEKSETLG